MFKRIRNLHPVTGLVIGVVATLVLSGTAMAVTDASFTYSTVQTGYLMIGPGDLVPSDSTSANNYQLDSFAAYSFSTACFRAPVRLPEGARMTNVRTSYLSGSSSNPLLGLRRTNPVTGTGDGLITRDYVVDDSNVRTFVIDPVLANLRLVNNAQFMYTYLVCVGSSTAFYGARIAYTYTSAGD